MKKSWEINFSKLKQQKYQVNPVVFQQEIYMLVGDEHAIKPDRMVRRFVFDAIQRELNAEECQELLSAACDELAKEFPSITPRSLDHQIWLYQRGAVNE